MHTLCDSAVLDPTLKDCRASMAFADTGVAADVLTQTAAQCALAAVDVSQIAKLAAGGFFGVAAVREGKRTAREELRRAVERVWELEGQASKHSPLFGEWKTPEGAREAGKALLDKAVTYVRHKDLDKGAEGKFVEQSAAFKAQKGEETAEDKVVTFDALGDVRVARAAGEAALAIRRVVEEAGIAVRPVVAIASKALAKAVLTPEQVSLADEEFRGAFNIVGDRRPLYFVYPVGDVEYGAVKAKGVKAVAFVSGEKTLRIEVLAEGIEGLAAEAERVKALGGEWVRLATFEIDVESGLVQLIPRVEASVQVRAEPISAKRLSALALTDAGKGGEYLGSPDPTLHLLYALAVGEAEVKVSKVVFTEAGPTLHLESRTPAERVNWLYEEVARELAELGVVVGVQKLRRMAKAAAVEAIGEYAGEVKRIAKEARGMEELRAKLIELFDKAAEGYQCTGSEEALWRAVGAVVAKKFFAENVDDLVWWALLLLGDGVVNVRDHAIGFAAKPAETAEAVMHVFACVVGVPPEVRREGNAAVLSRGASRVAVERLFKRLEDTKIGNASAHQLLTATAEWWLGVGTGGSRPPKLISLLAFRELAAGKEGEWLRAWLSYEAVVTTAREEVERRLEGAYRVFVKPSHDQLTSAVAFDVYFERGGDRFVLHTDFTDFRLYCESCSGASAESVLRAVAEALGVGPRLEGGERGEKRLVLPADVGWAAFLKLWHKYNMSLPIEEDGEELLRIEVLEARADGSAKFRLWYYKWRETRPDRPYVDIEIEPYQPRNGRIGFISYVSANKAKGIYEDHLAEIAKLLEEGGVEGVSLMSDGKRLQFTGTFRDSVCTMLGIRPELPPGEPPAVQHLGNYKFKIGDREVEFKERVISGRYEFYAELRLTPAKEAVRLASSLKAIGVDTEVVGNTVRLDSDALFGLLATTNATPPGLAPLYRSEEDDFRVYAAVEGGRMRFYFAIKHGGVWRVVEGLYGKWYVELRRAKREVLEAVRDAMAKALKMLGRPAEVEEPKEKKNEEGDVGTYRLRLYSPHVTPFLEHAAEAVKAQPAEARLEERRIVIKAGGVENNMEFKLLKRGKVEHLTADDVTQTLALYKSLKEVGARVEITPEGVKVDSEALWALVAAAVERSAPSGLPTEVMPGIELLKIYNVGGMRMYAFRVSEEGIHYYFVIKTEQGWRAAGGKYSERQVQIAGQAALIIADAINALYREMGVKRKVEVGQMKNGEPYTRLTNVDLELLLR